MADEYTRTYTMTDPELIMFTINLVTFLNRDKIEFSTKGIDQNAIDALKSLVDVFKVNPNDKYYKADVMIAIDAKNEYRANTELKMREILGCARIKWGERSAQVKRFEAGKMTKLNDKGFLTLCRQVVVVAEDYLLELSGQGLTQEMINSMASEAQQMENELNNIAANQTIRDLKTQDRVQMGNEVYSYVARYCEVGKILWQDTDYAKYNEYVIYNRRPSKASKVENKSNLEIISG